jgi:hypothetical protein
MEVQPLIYLTFWHPFPELIYSLIALRFCLKNFAVLPIESGEQEKSTLETEVDS